MLVALIELVIAGLVLGLAGYVIYRSVEDQTIRIICYATLFLLFVLLFVIWFLPGVYPMRMVP